MIARIEHALARNFTFYETIVQHPHSARSYGRLLLCCLCVDLLARGCAMALFGLGLPTQYSLAGVLFQTLWLWAIYSVVRSAWVALACQFVVNLALWTVNAEKLYYLQNTLLPTDFLLIGEMLQVSTWVQKVIFFGASALPLSIMAGLIITHSRRPTRQDAAWLLPSLLLVAVIVGAPNHYVQAIEWALRDTAIGRPMALKLRLESLSPTLDASIELARFIGLQRGLPSHDAVQAARTDLLRWSRLPQGAAPAMRSNVYIILTESFWDPAVLTADAHLRNTMAAEFMQLWARTGNNHLISPVYGGGTPNTEFEVLCGVPAAAASDGIVFQTALVNPMPCLPRILRAHGYHAIAFQAIVDSYYNWNVAAPLLGFERLYGIRDYPVAEHQNTALSLDLHYVMDDFYLHNAISTARRDAHGEPFLAYMMTYAGHAPFAWHDCYSKDLRMTTQGNEPLTETERFLNITRYTSRLLAHVVAEIQAADASAIIVVSGDHAPSLAQDLLPPLPDGHLDPQRTFNEHLTPLVIAGPRAPPETLRPIAAFELPSIVLTMLGIDAEMQNFTWLAKAPAAVLRPLAAGSDRLLLAGDPNAVAACGANTTDTAPICQEADRWFADMCAVVAELTHGQKAVVSAPP